MQQNQQFEPLKADQDIIDIIDVAMRISQLDDSPSQGEREAQPLWNRLYSKIDAFSVLYRGVSPKGSLNDYLTMPFEEWVESPEQIENKDLCWTTLMIDGRMNHGQFRQYCPDQEEGVLFGEFKQLVAQARSMIRTGDAAQTLYREIRSFLTVNPTASSTDLGEFLHHLEAVLTPKPQITPANLMQKVRDFLQKAYLHADTSAAPSFEVVCTHCQAPAPRGRSGRPVCLGSPWHSTLVGYGVEDRIPEHDRVLTPRLLADITGPGRAEVELFQDVISLGIPAELYPGIDACDIGFEIRGRPYHVDLKCWTTDAQLKEKILAAGLPKGLPGVSRDSFYIVVPDDIARLPNYISNIRGWLSHEPRARGFLHLDHIMSHSQFMNHIRKAI
jgi:hypothetical protein